MRTEGDEAKWAAAAATDDDDDDVGKSECAEEPVRGHRPLFGSMQVLF